MKRATKDGGKRDQLVRKLQNQITGNLVLIKKLGRQLLNLKRDIPNYENRMALSKKIDPDLLTALLYCATYKAESRILAKKVLRLETEINFLNTMGERTKP